MQKGQLLNGLNTPTQVRCGGECKMVDGCQWYSYDQSNQFCLLFSTCPTIDDAATSFITNQVDCSIEKSNLEIP